ncbi:MAG: hypothetical protein JXX28_09010 [Deltaproteobacteria bacterium]|nr:hypothetical protein [Deltaproteobacteria bacterium]
MQVGILGGGRWGQALARVVMAAGHQPLIAWKDVKPPHLFPSSNKPPEVSERCELLLVAASGSLVRQAIRLAAPGPHNRVVVAGRGVEPGTGTWLTEVVLQESDVLRVGALAGPAPVEEILQGGLCAGVVASPFKEVQDLTTEALHCSRYRVYHSHDLLGVQIASAAVPVIASLLSITSGLRGAGTGLNALVLTRALSETSRLVEAMGGAPETLYGLAGLGDLLAVKEQDRYRVPRGERPPDGPVALAQALLRLAAEHHVEMPLTEGLEAFHRGVDPLEVVGALMARKAQPERR